METCDMRGLSSPQETAGGIHSLLNTISSTLQCPKLSSLKEL
jgi:hypothetical protein